MKHKESKVEHERTKTKLTWCAVSDFRFFSLAPVLRGEGRGEGLFKLDNPFQKIPAG
jgi:hypothetical protein